MYGGTSAQDSEVRVVDLATGEMKLLVPGGFASYTPTGHIVYWTVEGVIMAAPFDPEALELTGDPVGLLEGVGGFVLADNGTLVYHTDDAAAGGASVEPVWISRSGEIALPDPGWKFDRGGDANFGFRLSPDGRRLAVRAFAEANYDIWIKLLEVDGPFSRLTRATEEDRMPRWSSDGRMVTFLSRRGGSVDLWQTPSDGTGAPELLYDAEAELAQGFWAPGGEWLILRTTTGTGVGGRDILAIRPGVDSIPVRLLAEDYDEVAPAISPDGRWLAYGSNETGRYEVFVRPFPDVNAGKLQISNAGGSQPLWSQSGGELFYHDTEARIVSVRLSTTPSLAVASRTPLFTVPEGFIGRGGSGSFITGTYDVAPDGRFLMIRPAAGANQPAEAGEEPTVVVVLNWFEELRARVAR
jgi:serine/threonine-protein kinase